MVTHRAVPQDGPRIAARRGGGIRAALIVATGLLCPLLSGPAAAGPNDYDGDWAMNLSCTANTISGWGPLTMNIPITLRGGVGESVRAGPNQLGGRDTNRWSFRVNGNSITIRNDGSANDGRTWL